MVLLLLRRIYQWTRWVYYCSKWIAKIARNSSMWISEYSEWKMSTSTYLQQFAQHCWILEWLLQQKPPKEFSQPPPLQFPALPPKFSDVAIYDDINKVKTLLFSIQQTTMSGNKKYCKKEQQKQWWCKYMIVLSYDQMMYDAMYLYVWVRKRTEPYCIRLYFSIFKLDALLSISRSCTLQQRLWVQSFFLPTRK